VPTPADYRKQFIKAFERLAHHCERHDVLADFLEMAVCAIRKKTPPVEPVVPHAKPLRPAGKDVNHPVQLSLFDDPR
jgi:hypothetical protein